MSAYIPDVTVEAASTLSDEEEQLPMVQEIFERVKRGIMYVPHSAPVNENSSVDPSYQAQSRLAYFAPSWSTLCAFPD
jgi:hypothetical protein